MKLADIRFELGSMISMAPAPWQWDRGQIKCANGNGITPVDIVDYLNMTFKALPALLEVAETATYYASCIGVHDNEAPIPFDDLWKAIMALAHVGNQKNSEVEP